MCTYLTRKKHFKYNNQINIAKAVEKIIRQKDKAPRSAFIRHSS